MRSVTGEAVFWVPSRRLPGKGQTLDSYIIRIYRRGADCGHEVAGLIERVGNGKRQAFANSEELWAFLTGRQPSRKRGTSGSQSSKTQP